ncbi:MAG: NAD(P)H-dependent oxidoreductase [Alphaproteobacteria bacterium]|nr:NAD(P)H-dependent oxidoreductase [Alphaproteobacteria bacterium]
MSRIIVLYAHPNPRRSKVNARLIEAVGRMEEVQVRDLYELYPNLHVNVAAEQEALRNASAVVMQFPIYWFSAPALLKEWQDTVLAKGFAFGPNGTELAGKPFMLVATTGGEESSYAEGKAHGAEIGAYLKPFEQTARFCGMKLVEPLVVHGANSLTPLLLSDLAEQYQERLQRLAKKETV